MLKSGSHIVRYFFPDFLRAFFKMMMIGRVAGGRRQQPERPARAAGLPAPCRAAPPLLVRAARSASCLAARWAPARALTTKQQEKQAKEERSNDPHHPPPHAPPPAAAAHAQPLPPKNKNKKKKALGGHWAVVPRARKNHCHRCLFSLLLVGRYALRAQHYVLYCTTHPHAPRAHHCLRRLVRRKPARAAAPARAPPLLAAGWLLRGGRRP